MTPGDPPGSVASAVDPPLSAREMEVLALLHRGCTNQEIADRLFITERTVKKHVSSILTKLQVPNRTSAVRRATHLGIRAEPG